MTIKDEAFISHIDYQNFWDKKYNTQGLVKSHSIIFQHKEFCYNENAQITFETLREHLGGDVYDVFYKTQYEYLDLIIRKYTYKTGYTTFREQDNYDFEFDPPKYINPPIHQVDELVKIEEINTDVRGNIIKSRITDFITNSILNKEFKYTDDGKILFENEFKNGVKIKEKTHENGENSINKIIINSFEDGLKTILEFNIEGKEISRKYLRDIDESCLCSIFIGYEENLIIVKIENAYSVMDLNAFDFLQFPDEQYFPDLNDYYDLKNPNFELRFSFNANNHIKEIVLLSLAEKKVLERRYFIYEYLPQSREEIITYISGIKVTETDIQQVFSYHMNYY